MSVGRIRKTSLVTVVLLAGTTLLFSGLAEAQNCVVGNDFFGLNGTRGIFVATGDVNGDFCADIVVGSEQGGEPRLRVYHRGGGDPFVDNLVYPAGFTGGVRVAVADIGPDLDGPGGKDEIIVASGPQPGGGSHIRTFNVSGGTLQSRGTFFAFPGFSGGAYVAGGNVNSAGFGEVVVGAGAGGGPHVLVFKEDGTALEGFFPYDGGFPGGVRVAVGNTDGVDLAEVITGAGPGGGSHVRVLTGTGDALWSVFAYPGFSGGVFVGSGFLTADSDADVVTGAGESPGGASHVRLFGGDGTPLWGLLHAYAPGFYGGVRVASGSDLVGDICHDIVTVPGPSGGPHVRRIDAEQGC
jgi:hypothetical protein